MPRNDRGDIQTHRQQGDLTSLLSFFQNRESRRKKRLMMKRKNGRHFIVPVRWFLGL
jgi:hypothetical protein